MQNVDCFLTAYRTTARLKQFDLIEAKQRKNNKTTEKKVRNQVVNTEMYVHVT